MKNIYIPPTPEAYHADLRERAYPDEEIVNHPFYKNLISWIEDNRTPLLYEQDHEDEYTNFSINYNWLLLRDYTNTRLGESATILTMYAIHESSHMTNWLPVRLTDLSSAEYAQQFQLSEYRASNETELAIHRRIPGLRKRVLTDQRILFDALEERGFEWPSASEMVALRSLLVEGNTLDAIFDTDEDRALIERLKGFSGNIAWATERFEAIKPHFSDPDLPLGTGLTIHDYEPTIESYESKLTPELYEKNIVRNVKLGFAMCGLAMPEIYTLADAQAAAKELEGHHAIVQS